MAQDANIKIAFTSDTSQAVAGVGQVTNKLKEVPAASKAAGDGVKGFNDRLRDIPQSGGKAGKGAKEAGDALKNIPSVSDRASNALLNLNRVVQDSPYGFIGIANNLNPLLESFQRLKETAGTTGGAFKALLSSLTGPGGLGIALAAITAAMSFVQIGFSMWSRGAKEAAESTKTLEGELTKAAAGAQTEVLQLQSLVGIARDETQSRQTRTNALKELQKEYPGYLQNITLETINSEAAIKAIDSLTAALIRKAKAQAISNILTQQLTELFEKQNKPIEDYIGSINTAALKLAKFNKDAASIKELTDLGLKFKSEDIFKSNEALNKTFDLLKAVNTEQAAAGDFAGLSPEKTKALKDTGDTLEKILKDFKQFEFISGQRALNEGTSEISNRIDAIKSSLDRLFALHYDSKSKEVQDFVNQLKRLEAIQAGVFTVKADVKIPELVPPETLTNLDRAAEKVRKIYAEIQANTNKQTGGIISEAQLKKMQEFGQFVNTYLTAPISDFFSTLMNGGQNALEAFGQMIKGIITKLIAAAISAAIFAAIVTAVFPASAAASGGFKGVFGQAMGLGNLLKGSATADGGIFSGPSMRLVGEYSGAKSNPEVISPLNKLKGMIADSQPRGNTTQTFVLRGVDLVASGERGNRFINR